MFQFTVQGRGPSWQQVKAQEPEAAGHRTAIIRKQRGVNASVQLAFPFLYSLHPKLRGNGASHFWVNLPTSVNLIKTTPPSHAQS